VIYRFSDCELDTELFELRRRGARRQVEPQVFDVLAYLIAHRDRVVTREELVAQVWGHSYLSDATLNSRLMAARKAIGDDGRTQELIRTLRGRGYRFVARVEQGLQRVADGVPGTPLVGRAAERAVLGRLLDEAAGGQRRLALVTGEAGIGKTTLVDAFAAEAVARTQLLVANGRCVEQPAAAEPYMPVLEALGTLARTDAGPAVVETLSTFAPSWLPQLPGVAGEAVLEAARDRAQGAGPERMLRELLDAVRALSMSNPLLLLFEDLHWSDGSTLALLAHFARGDEPARVMVVGTSRPARGQPVEELLRELRPRGRCIELPVPPLTPEEVERFVERGYGRVADRAALAETLHRRTDGNPLFVDCLLRSWRETGVPPGDGQVPDTLRELIEQDAARLDSDDRRLLEAASVAGPEFSAAVAAAAAGMDDEAAEERCAELAREGSLLRWLEPRELPDGTVTAAFAFTHELHRQVIYEGLPAGRRTRLHRDVAVRLELAYGTRASEHAAELAGHFVQGRLHEPAIRHLRLSAEQALRRGAPDEAVRELRAALDLLAGAPEPPERERSEMELLGVLAGALTAREGWASAEAERAYRRALELARELGDERSRAALLYGLAGLHEYRGQYRASETLLDEALRLDEAEPARLVEAHELMACSLFHQGSFETAVEQADRGLALHEPAQRHPIPATAGEDPAVSCNDWAGLSLWCLGHTEQALERIEAALEMASLPGRSFSKAAAHVHAARLHQLRRVPGEVRAQSEAALALAQEHGFGYPAAVARMLLGWALGQTGAVEDGIEMLTAGLDAHRATGAEMDRPYFLALMAETLLAARRPAEALTHVVEALETGAEERSFFYEAELHRLHAAALLDMSGSEAAQEARAALRTGLELARRQGARSLELRLAVSLAQVLGERDGSRDALDLLSGTLGWFARDADSADLREARSLEEHLARRPA
jgi:DNA-binding winged helix-turn-helix (wHTH) protein/predicted ATPase